MVSDVTFKLIPGFYLIDHKFSLSADSTGRSNQKHDLFTYTLPKIKRLVRIKQNDG